MCWAGATHPDSATEVRAIFFLLSVSKCTILHAEMIHVNDKNRNYCNCRKKAYATVNISCMFFFVVVVVV